MGIAAVVQLALGLALLSGFRVSVERGRDAVQRLIQVTLAKPPPPPLVKVQPKPAPRKPREQSAPRAEPAKPGGSPGPVPHHAPPSVQPIVAIRPNAAPSGGGSGTGPAAGSGSGGGSGGEGYGSGDGVGEDLVQIAGEITPRDYPRHLGNAGVGGTVEGIFTVLTNGRVTGCRVTRSSGVPELDQLTCRLMEQRYRFRPATDRTGRPVSEVVDWDHQWIADDRRH